MVLISNGAESYRLEFWYAHLIDYWELRLLNWASRKFPSVYGIGVIGRALGRRHSDLMWAKPPPRRTGWRVQTVEVQITEP
jgi:hypothetical protein